MESKTIRLVKIVSSRGDAKFSTNENGLALYTTDPALMQCEELDITITPIASPEERLREARRKVIEDHVGGCPDMLDATVIELERVDAEFLRQRKA